jgi:hypothetical protein
MIVRFWLAVQPLLSLFRVTGRSLCARDLYGCRARKFSEREGLKVRISFFGMLPLGNTWEKDESPHPAVFLVCMLWLNETLGLESVFSTSFVRKGCVTS